jgi:serine/threonine protein kinase
VIQLFTEAKILEALKHPHIINLKDFYKTHSNKLVLILEYASGSDLGRRIQEMQGARFDETLVRS